MKIKFDVSQFQDYVKARTLSHYYSLPDYARSHISVEDCQQDALLFMHKTLNRLEGRKVKFDKDKSKLTTFVYQIIETYFNHLCKKHFRKKRTAVLIAIDGIENLIKTCEKQTDNIVVNEAINKIVTMHLNTPPHILSFIAQNIYYPKSPRFTVSPTSEDVKYEKNIYTKNFRKKKLCKEEIISKRCIEFRLIANKYNVTPNDYRLALSVERRKI